MADIDEQDITCLQAWRVFAGLTQDQLGLMVGVTGAQISRVETGKRDYDGRYLNKIKGAINKTLEAKGETLVRVGHVGDLLMHKPDYWLMVPGARARWDDVMQVTEDHRADTMGTASGASLPAQVRRATS